MNTNLFSIEAKRDVNGDLSAEALANGFIQAKNWDIGGNAIPGAGLDAVTSVTLYKSATWTVKVRKAGYADKVFEFSDLNDARVFWREECAKIEK